MPLLHTKIDELNLADEEYEANFYNPNSSSHTNNYEEKEIKRSMHL